MRLNGCFTMTHSQLLSNVSIWIGIACCITQSAIFSGLNLAIFSISKLRLEVEAAGSNRDAVALLALRKDSNLTLATVLWGNVTINVLLTLLSNSVLAGVGAFAFSTIVITLFGEIIPQAYFSRNALRMASLLAPLLKVYQVGLFPLAKLTAIILNWWLAWNRSFTRAGLSSVYHKTRRSCGCGRRTIGGNRSAEFLRPRRHPCDG
jgi:metal transporter CNNM